jgi:hypothetical protein
MGLLSHHFNEILDDPKFQIFYHAPMPIVIASLSEGPGPLLTARLPPRT